MSSAAVATLRAELTTQHDELVPEIRGLHDMVNDPHSLETKTALEAQILRLERRLNVVNANLSGLQDLDTDGYPDLPPMQVTPEVLADLKGEEADVAKAVGGFAATPEATELNVNLGDQPTS